MRHFIKYSVAALAAFSLTFTTVPASAADREKPKSRKELARENARMREVLDSLISELENVRSKAVHHIPEQADEGGLAIEGLLPEDYTLDVTDSLLSLWYVHKSMLKGDTVSFNMDSVHFRSSVTDKEYLQRLADMNSFITLPFNETVRNYIILYSEKMPTKMSSMLALSQYYFPIFEEIFDRYGLPKELKYMAVIESAFNPVAVSRAGAKGMWQFMYNTAKMYGLTINSFVDERLDPVKSADAAARYMRDAYRIFGDWNLAISSYNCGSGNVNKAMRRSGSREFWPVYNYLPRETRGYVPAFVGAMYAFTYYREHGLVPETDSMPVQVDTFHIRRMLHFQQVSALTGVSVEMLKKLNPQYVHDIVPGTAKEEYVLRLPYQYTSKFIENEDSVYAYNAKEYFSPATLQNIAVSGSASSQRIAYKVKSGDYLGRIASRYHVTVKQIMEWNHLRNTNLRVGQVLYIYGKFNGPVAQSSGASSKSSAASSSKGSASSDGATRASSKGSAATPPPADSAAEGTYTVYVVKSGDSLYRISQDYPGVSADDIMKFNGIGTDIRPGMKLKIPKK
ncbi:MAG: LysM peptidoglycan-binding domain-containing protein [Candidatus Cryptobacteroides sp.]|nr:LysM peptidoglycan-binding domain-containing protein [Bacteroidales bacterium]MDY2859429.1 LysM peptidoglycan-binding domain-containing protein [Candidatus Cryptobacteroides sp.]MCI7635735.1 LysM peptidoglycan-binding domain-containing protein [Bacteroidales bacterium]MDD7117865.1 LysM peptidoglycan-binding domain-containing protein [Bacteroidales bacterium]MDY5441805.1 LysM peptidoglycan-binding domain-containing protein [Candidatus Cryptobacteroides sp.]